MNSHKNARLTFKRRKHFSDSAEQALSYLDHPLSGPDKVSYG